MENKVVEWILKYQLVAISRGVKPELMVKTAKALYDGGVRSLEITFNQASDTCIQDTETSIKQVKQALGDKMCIGAGTVMTIEQAEAAYKAGADFALAPDTNIDVIKKIVKLGMAAVPGALTPTEIAAAYQAGASIVKLFPAGNMGLNYVKAIRGPINHVPLMAVGGVNVENIREFLDNGFTSVGIGSNIVKNSLIEAGKFDEITALAKAYTEQLEK
ncbi:MAG: bifunctional 4-hydroxy-2-oxoglutarate aldolase/2-dehydro-3-deoxy-phosphogluconate aldolase [Lachnoclostridium edouardi]|uniref:bifunctional 4-hydroxy-2-oxoglutarate aldolase/2-dehydro-3-deoxy-phosphogluconate aldolase n=1 Tax=Lachnoclostridium edouardi TaxID=1926283 RepID=UPI0026DD5178|nr:bifunctional 4-hydroxy-2-oxoglutarate aldolase/2-dehydro-3-deoxy-phosphogluconate aldolase [Lachnoclostridium edouardi]MDO4277593.1 bifunctional 4-hydroxy-2-oxoglutarate aldolase/2-dehydro-3-deoxy-phosphogluconate aldolase [Lachnoclostridium edouardi]